jgi:hypothetical protein
VNSERRVSGATGIEENKSVLGMEFEEDEDGRSQLMNRELLDT